MQKWALRVGPVLAILLVIAGCSGMEPRRWIRYVDKEKRFSIDIPRDFQSIDRVERTAFGSLPVFTLYWRTAVFAIADMDVKLLELSNVDVSAALNTFSKEQLLDSAMSYFREHQYDINRNGRVIRFDSIRKSTFPGRYLIACEDVTKADSLIVFVKAYLVGSRLYTIKANGYKASIKAAVVDSFLNSFRILGPAETSRME